jgi:uncharacterized SAM-dependent methyltransferase
MKSDSLPLSPFSMLVLLREEEIARQLRRAFRDRYLPEHLFYWLPSSVHAWVELCRSTEYKNANRSLELLRLTAPKLALRLSQSRALCGLGCGEGSKDRVLLEAFASSGKKLDYIAADFSQALLELAANSAEEVAAIVSGCKMDIFDDAHLGAVIGAARANSFDAPVLFSILGNTLGAFDPKAFPARMRTHLHQQDRLVFDGEIFSEHTLAGYDNPTNRRFAWGPLTGVGITEADGRLEFSTAPGADRLFAVTKHFLATRDLHVNLGGEAIEIRAGEKLRMSSSIKYASESALLGLVETGGFKIESSWKSADGSFVLACARPE